MEELSPEIKADLTSLADSLCENKRYTMAIVLAVLRRDATLRTMIAEELGEQALREQADDETALIEVLSTSLKAELPRRKTWDEIMLEVITRLEATPGGRGEPLPLSRPVATGQSEEVD